MSPAAIDNKVVSRDEWIAARKDFLVKEKELTAASDAVSKARRAMPMVKVEKDYSFKDADNKTVTLADLFHGKDQLIVYHFMFDPAAEEGCRGCSHIGETLPDVRHLRFKNTNLVCVSRAEQDKLQAFKKANGWTWPWYSSGGSDFNYDFFATVDEKAAPVFQNFRNKEELAASGRDVMEGDFPGVSVFAKKDGEIYHTYSSFERGTERLLTTFMLLDLTPLGRQDGKSGPAEFPLNFEYDEKI